MFHEVSFSSIVASFFPSVVFGNTMTFFGADYHFGGASQGSKVTEWRKSRLATARRIQSSTSTSTPKLYWGLRQRAQTGALSGLRDDRTIAQLAGIRYSLTRGVRSVIESKEEARKRGVKSPDLAEAVMLAFAEEQKPEPSILGYYRMLAEEAEARR